MLRLLACDCDGAVGCVSVAIGVGGCDGIDAAGVVGIDDVALLMVLLVVA